MNDRYTDARITTIWSLEHKYELWQRVELAYLDAQITHGNVTTEESMEIGATLLNAPINVERIAEIEAITFHDLNAFVAERREHLPAKLQGLFHRGNTSYDTEEPAMALMLRASYDVVVEELVRLQHAVHDLAHRHQFTIMIARTHGQEAELMSFGKRWLGFLQDLNTCVGPLTTARRYLDYSKFSGAVGNYTSINPELEQATLAYIGLRPYIGATQIMPREAYAPLAFALTQICLSAHKIGLSVRLAGRSGRPFCHEPFGKGQMGSSAMPHKKNNIITEQLEAMARMALGYMVMLIQNIPTWEERAIEQSAVERVAWPDLFHVTVHALKRLTKVVSGLVVYPENMLEEVVASGGLYASNEAKELLRDIGESRGITAEEAYRIVQLAAFNGFDARKQQLAYHPPISLESASAGLETFQVPDSGDTISFKDRISGAELVVSPQLDADQDTVDRWNQILARAFDEPSIAEAWQELFRPSHLLRNERLIYTSVGIARLLPAVD